MFLPALCLLQSRAGRSAGAAGLVVLSSPVVSVFSGLNWPGKDRQGADALNLGVQIQIKDRNLILKHYLFSGSGHAISEGQVLELF